MVNLKKFIFLVLSACLIVSINWTTKIYSNLTTVVDVPVPNLQLFKIDDNYNFQSPSAGPHVFKNKRIKKKKHNNLAVLKISSPSRVRKDEELLELAKQYILKNGELIVLGPIRITLPEVPRWVEYYDSFMFKGETIGQYLLSLSKKYVNETVATQIDTQIDRVEMMAAAPIKPKAAQPAINESNEDFVFFSYGNENPMHGAGNVSRAVNSVIKREIQKPTQAMPQTRADTSTAPSGFVSSNEPEIVRLLLMAISPSDSKPVQNYEYTELFSSNEYFYDESGIVTIKYLQNSELNTHFGKMEKKDFVATNVWSSTFKGENTKVLVPFFTAEELIKIIGKQELNELGGFLLVKIPNKGDEIDIDGKYSKKILLSDKFNTVKEKPGYILFSNVSPGNTLIRLYRKIGSQTKKSEAVGHVIRNEVTYFAPNIISEEEVEVNLFEKRLLSNSPAELALEESQIHFFNNTQVEFTKSGTNHFEYTRPLSMGVTKDYLELSHNGESLFSSVSNSYLEIPSREFIGTVFSNFNIDKLGRQCIVQINLNSAATEFHVEGINYKEAMPLEIVYLDSDGVISKEMTEMTEKIFILGTYEGIVGFKVTYENKTIDRSMSYCSEDTYLIEHL